MDNSASLMALPSGGIQTRVTPGAENMTAQVTLPMDVTVSAGQGMTMITGLETGEHAQPDPNRPSLIVRRADGGLWQLARESGSTMEAIRQANGLEQEPAPGQLLLIPVM